MAALHELLAVLANLKGQSQKCRGELMSTFDKKKHLFGSKIVTLIPTVENQSTTTVEQSEIESTVKKELNWIAGIMTKAIDANYAVDQANTVAKADIVLADGTVLVKDVPATALLQLEKSVREISELLKTVPTLDPAKGFKPAPDQGDGVYAAREIATESTKKEQKALVLYPATDKHPAQVQLVTEDKVIGTKRTQEWSSMITPAVKAELIDRVEELFRAVTQARARANETDTNQNVNKIGAKLFEYILEPLKAA